MKTWISDDWWAHTWHDEERGAYWSDLYRHVYNEAQTSRAVEHLRRIRHRLATDMHTAHAHAVSVAKQMHKTQTHQR